MFSGCYYDVEEELYPSGAQSCDTTAVSYVVDIAPIMNRSCTSCHSGSSPSAGIVLSDYTNVRLYGEGGSLLGSVSHDPNYSAMPKGGNKLDDCSIDKIKAWASQGYRN
jgi:cytochrome c5